MFVCTPIPVLAPPPPLPLPHPRKEECLMILPYHYSQLTTANREVERVVVPSIGQLTIVNHGI